MAGPRLGMEHRSSWPGAHTNEFNLLLLKGIGTQVKPAPIPRPAPTTQPALAGLLLSGLGDLSSLSSGAKGGKTKA